MLYKVLIDESGKKEYKSPYSQDFTSNPPAFKDYEEFWRDNYFVLCGLRVKQGDINQINKRINELKHKYFATHKVEVKSDWLRNPHQRKKHYFDVYGIIPEKLNEFGEKFVDLIAQHNNKLKLIGVIFDKRFYGDAKRRREEGNPLLKTTQLLFERLEYASGYNIVIFDQMESSLKLTIGHHDKILGIFRKNIGMEKIYVDKYTKITDIKFKKSSRENFLQAADICAYNIFRQFVEFGREWTGKAKNRNGKIKMNMYEYFDRIRCNFMYHPINKTVRGVGLTCLPDLDKINWNILEGCFNNKKTPQ
ncbi:DUF3800 domain-containing protein [Patescibacteria group bacterium AH-259-L07]|nr:DUF3800 domain-containing protein [Patescibacteria group bacterium AH-259-L07]